ncbi:Carboxylesterase type B [Macrophomina phaseolina MS6]|uniref:Carboxylic ester hydrolase n=1 Tax=Macrophomina phaseolina (strain MS6) TaxID=1126212 RepID=K2S4T0_MACPH|nr:Carboxylesterase type B [Macrophomina phaseolina MS6]
MLLSLFALPCLHAAAAFARLAEYAAVTSNGPIIGHPANTSGVVEYLGIPYAQPPVGPLRFAAPQKHIANGTFVASHYGYTCPQTASARVNYAGRTPQAQRIIADFAGQLNHTQSEDCLTLNVWTRPRPGAPKPVLVFIHGGRFTIGESNTPFFHGDKIAGREELVVVTLNYRVSIWGFPGQPGAAKNLAFLDQRLAVEWVRDNIAAFGGDPDKIVISGQSAGGAAVDFWSYAYKHDPIASGIIPHSGTAFSFPTSSESTAASRWYNVSAQLGCGDSGDVLECVRSRDVGEIKTAVAALRLPPVSGQGRSEAVFQPTVDNKTAFSRETLTEMTQTGNFARVPYLVGNTHFEAGYYRWAAYGAGSILTETQWDNFDLVTFTCPSTYGAAARARFGVPSWLFRYGGDWDNVRLYPNSSAYHGADMHMLFGNSVAVSGLPEEKAQDRLKKVVMHAWATFAKDPQNGLQELGWSQYETGTLIELGFEKSSVPAFVSPDKYAGPCPTLNLSFYDI